MTFSSYDFQKQTAFLCTGCQSSCQTPENKIAEWFPSFWFFPSSVVTGLMLLLFVFVSGGWEGVSAHASPARKRQTRFVSQRPNERTPVMVSSQDREIILRLQFLLYLDMLENLKLYQHFELFRQVHALATTGTLPPAKKP